MLCEQKARRKGNKEKKLNFMKNTRLLSTHKLLASVYLPPMALVRQRLPHPKIDNIGAAVREELERSGLRERLRPGAAVAISCGSRGISNLSMILREIVSYCVQQGAKPFIFPAMGSHGGATGEGQKEVLESLGVTEKTCGCPIISSMETVQIGVTENGRRVFIDRSAYEADGIIVVGRIKPHTAFRGRYESGLMKMIAVGMGKKDGAEVCHSTGFRLIHEIIPEIASTTLKKANILLGFGIVENAYDETCIVRGLRAEEIAREEPLLLEQARSLMGRLYLPETDLLIIDRIGKNISGDGSDPNIAGNFCCPYATGGLKAEKRIVLDLTDETEGNAMGVGLYDATTRRLVDKIDLDKTYTNPLVSTAINMAKIPMIFENDRDAIAACLKASPEIDHENPRIIRIKDSAHIDEIYVSSAHREEVLAHPQLELIGEFKPFAFDEEGNLW